ncbi:flagellar hook-associated protein FlgK [Thalassotalea piscium]|uniref:Flagellar hook-associated protein 1 n=1 Tax=Thalassotalea piscium TaxID=1230533 RepID=A0A7X0TUZ4_9GAMM|nr:flagellar hook-associated protein FlgK [Thalassotalea piscium]MBB6544723.1 flagellar hook-associated protein 1 FlgK [Thalassotalea piscium]
MSVSLYQTGVSGLLAAQQQLATTGNNIANVNTEGYNRQRAEQNALLGHNSGGNYIGSGTYVNDIVRIYDKFAYKEQLFNQSNLGNADTLHKDLNHLNQVMSFSGTSVVNGIDSFYQTINGIADNPSDLGLRSIALSQANILASDFRSLSENFDQLEKSANGEIEQMVSKISKISQELAKINEQVLTGKGLTVNGQPNEILDKRDQLIHELGEYTNVTAIEDQNGVMTVMIGSGATLVAGITPLTVSVRAGDPDPLKTQLQLSGPNSTVALNGAVLGGSLAAKMEFRDEHLAQTRAGIDRLALAISHTLNSAQQAGLDLNEQQGLNFFTDINTTALMEGRVMAPTKNNGTVAASVEITDVSLLTTDEYQVKYDGTNYVMTNMNTMSSTVLTLSPPNRYDSGEGFDFVIDSGAPVADDVFIVRPGQNSAALMKVTLTSELGIAASSSVEVKPSENNISDGYLKVSEVYDPVAARNYTATLNAGLTVDVYESAPGTYAYRVYDSGNPPPAPTIATGTFAAGASALIDLPPLPAGPAFQIEIGGDPVGQGPLARETYNIVDAFGIGNGANAVAIGLTQEKGVINGGKETFGQGMAISIAGVGSKAKSAELVATTADALYTQAFNRNQEISGVNLDEEAANMLKFQQAYQASSQIISTANTIFDTLLNAVR